MLLRFYTLAILLTAGVYAETPRADDSQPIEPAMDCVRISEASMEGFPTVVSNTCDRPVVFSHWFCGSMEAPCSSSLNKRWSEEVKEFSSVGGVYILCPKSDRTWYEQGFECEPVINVWWKGKYAYGACHFSNKRLQHWQEDVDTAHRDTPWIVGDKFHWNDACERWLARHTREVYRSNENPAEKVSPDITPPVLYSL